MPKTENYSSRKIKAFVDYKPAEVKINTDWLIVYYAKVPAQDEFKRFRKRVPVIKPKSERMKYAKKMAAAINLKLEQGWSPFYEDTNVQYKSLEYCSELFLQMQEREVEDGIKRPDTLRAYTSNLALFSQYLKAKKIQLKFIIEIDTYLINNYLDYIFYEKRNSSSTYNNHLRFMFTFLEWCKSKRFVNQNAAESIKHKPKTQKTREVLTGDVKKLLRESKNDNFNYFVLCMLTYYCFVRRTELTKLKVSDVQLHKGFIIISGENSKNRKSESVTIPDAFMPDLAQHLATAQNSDFLFSANDFKAGKKQLSPKKISDEWDKFRKKHRLPNKYQFYSLKDTGITDLLNSGVPAIKVRDQARHHDLKITEAYTARNKFADEVVKSANFEF